MRKIKFYESDLSLKEIYHAIRTLANINNFNEVDFFKEKICEKLKLNKEKSIIFGSATNALFALFKILKIKGEVIMPSISYAGIANAVFDSGANLNFCEADDDINPTFFNIKNVYNKNCRAVVIGNYSGVQPEELYKIRNFCKEKNMLLIEDRSSNLMGGKNNHLADFVIYSFSSETILNTIQGGMISINNNKYLKHKEELEAYSFLGMKKIESVSNGNIFLPGNMSLMSNVGASIGIAQIDRLNEIIEKRLENEKIYYHELEHDFHVPKISQYPKSWYWIKTGRERKQKIISTLKENNIEIDFKYYPLHLTDLYKKENKKLIKTEELNEQLICLPIHNGLKKGEIKKICEILKKVKINK